MGEKKYVGGVREIFHSAPPKDLKWNSPKAKLHATTMAEEREYNINSFVIRIILSHFFTLSTAYRLIWHQPYNTQ